MWEVKYHNWENKEWWEVTNGIITHKAYFEVDAYWLCNILNSAADYEQPEVEEEE